MTASNSVIPDQRRNLDNPRQLYEALASLRQVIDAEGRHAWASHGRHVPRRSAVPGLLNLAHYLALRRRDLRPLQEQLSMMGLSSLGRSEARVMPTLDAVTEMLRAVAGVDGERKYRYPSRRAFTRGQRLLQRHVVELFGAQRGERETRIMVTLPSEAAVDYEFVRDLVASGMDVARINCSHDDAAAWRAMAGHVRRACIEIHCHCTILMDLGGPKPRTLDVVMPHGKKRLLPGDGLLLTRGDPASVKHYPIQAACSFPEIIDQLVPNALVSIDDGRLTAHVDSIVPEGALLRVVLTRPKGFRLRAEKGLNFPDTPLRLTPLTPKDLQDLDTVAWLTDMVGYSFVQDPDDIDLLHAELTKRLGRSAGQIAIIAKIETQRAVDNLPEIIGRAAIRHPFGVMIARGDLAVELGYLRMAEMQEEILWVCEAASVPVIWATQVLESLVTMGSPSRAEMTDAAASNRAECVMLNKGPYVRDAVILLDDLLTRMDTHLVKKSPRLRALRAWPGGKAVGEAGDT